MRFSERAKLFRERWLPSHRDARAMGRFKVVAAWLAQVYDESRHRLCT